ncbi:MAG: hypothetical protein K0S12_1350 [Bacteroidetes bacterium]|jgi:hypothetical protein|nr:hypothetical protein [Bacteroidota bacterium]
MEKINLKQSEVSLLDEGIIHIHIFAGAEITMSDAVLIVEAMAKIGSGKKFPVLIDAGEFASVDKEVREFSASPEANLYTLADAIAFCNLGQKLIAKFYIEHNHPSVPTEIFANKQDAINWLKRFVRKT